MQNREGVQAGAGDYPGASRLALVRLAPGPHPGARSHLRLLASLAGGYDRKPLPPPTRPKSSIQISGPAGWGRFAQAKAWAVEVDLVVVAAGGEGRELGEVIGEPGRLLGQKDEAVLDHRRLCVEAPTGGPAQVVAPLQAKPISVWQRAGIDLPHRKGSCRREPRAAQAARRGRLDGHNTRLDVASVELMATEQVAQRPCLPRDANTSAAGSAVTHDRGRRRDAAAAAS